MDRKTVFDQLEGTVSIDQWTRFQPNFQYNKQKNKHLQLITLFKMIKTHFDLNFGI